MQEMLAIGRKRLGCFGSAAQGDTKPASLPGERRQHLGIARALAVGQPTFLHEGNDAFVINPSATCGLADRRPAHGKDGCGSFHDAFSKSGSRHPGSGGGGRRASLLEGDDEVLARVQNMFPEIGYGFPRFARLAEAEDFAMLLLSV